MTQHSNRREIRQDVIDSTLKFLTHVATHIAAHGGAIDNKSKMQYADQYHKSYDIFFAAVRTGYLIPDKNNTPRGRQNKYRLAISKFEPIHARKVIENHYDHHNEQSRNRNKEKKNPPAVHFNTAKTPHENVSTPTVRKDNVRKPILVDKQELALETSVKNSPIKKAKKGFSLFWGLIKINW